MNIGLELCKIFGLSGDRLKELTVIIKPGDLVRVEAEMYVFPDKHEQIVRTFHAVKLLDITVEPERYGD